MDKTVLISLPIEDLQSIIIDCVNSCLKYHKQISSPLKNEEADLTTVQGAAELLDVTVSTVYGYVHRQEIPVNKRGKRLYFSKKELTEWVKAGRKKTVSEIEAEAVNCFISKKKGGKTK